MTAFGGTESPSPNATSSTRPLDLAADDALLAFDDAGVVAACRGRAASSAARRPRRRRRARQRAIRACAASIGHSLPAASSASNGSPMSCCSSARRVCASYSAVASTARCSASRRCASSTSRSGRGRASNCCWRMRRFSSACPTATVRGVERRQPLRGGALGRAQRSARARAARPRAGCWFSSTASFAARDAFLARVSVPRSQVKPTKPGADRLRL